MRLATLRTDEGTRAARREEGFYAVLPHASVGALLSSDDWLQAAAAEETGRVAVAEADFAPVVPHPNKIICLGLNYATHIKEMGRDTPRYPTLFAKYDGALIGAHDPVVLPVVSDTVDWEAELAVVIGRSARHVAESEALEYVAGYTVANDVTVREYQRRTREFLAGKTFEATTPLGPELVTADEFGGREPDLEILCEVDGEVMQRSRTSDLLFGVPDIVAYVSGIITLLPGDVILTGTPGGVGDGRDPKVYLAPGQVLRTVIECLGETRNRCLRESGV
ncbi:5-carboxymethyl-2-hydroxymuconateDelta-isomerase [Catenulispora acidiphila DSM 44928]|uniref:5-carboxymethyl-2-hydroxymuconateDelta-isomerase n=1 Tax=Catenulispora acidiphila (strain DSM 44928 / JCM 14897 / NBRC 102108 / NRRL B-24433 / ID139908) TaxID=479433 RepID=C7PWN5_CATAD|nr:fumarylacetoacetate hydrolase family protein [Catenulispora acidiphila]ACU75315.1 5-carboxymethyl-2-hydroxymuconateDelta-isomerase [Catenulispora acidiphila DSM 44928]